tara:strand:+ start:141 stop:851 length:711 start_codon:yes stop_codon:yes gene_type:complete
MGKNMNYLFDVDGTLTPSRLPIDKKFEKFFLDWMKNKNVYLVTGSDKDKTIEQVGEKIWTNVTRAYQSCGNAVYENGKLIEQKDFFLNIELKKLLLEFVKWSHCPRQFDNHIEERIGLINFSSIGRTCPQEARDEYYEWDTKSKERDSFCKIIEERFPNIEASVGGQISIDIHPRGKNKAQVLDEIEGEIVFFGDKCEPGGNDYPIVERLFPLIDEHIIHNVKDWKETYKILKQYS